MRERNRERNRQRELLTMVVVYRGISFFSLLDRVCEQGLVNATYTMVLALCQTFQKVTCMRQTITISWNLSIVDTLGTAENVLISEVSSFQG